MAKISVVMPTLNQFETGLKALESVRTKHDWTPIIIPNWKNKWTLSKAWNEGIRKAVERDSDYILIINDDIVLSPTTIDNMITFFDFHPEAVLVSAFDMRESMTAEEVYDDGWSGSFTDSHFDEKPDFACFMVRPDTVEKIGWFDENFSPAYFEDNDYHRRIVVLGHKAYSTTSALFYHYGSRTQYSDPYIPVVPSTAFEVNRLYFESKWGGSPGKELYVTPFNDKSLTPKDC